MLNTIPFHGTLLGREIPGRGKSTNGHVLVYGAIEVHAFGQHGCIASNNTIAEETGLSLRTVQTYVSEIAKAGWIQIVLDPHTRDRLEIIPLMELSPATLRPQSKGVSTPVVTPYDHSRNPLRPQSNIDNIKNTSRKQLNNHQVEELLETVIGIINPREKVTENRRTRIRARLRDGYTSEDIIAVAQQLKASEWHQKNKQMTVDNMLSPDKFGKLYAKVEPVSVQTKAEDLELPPLIFGGHN